MLTAKLPSRKIELIPKPNQDNRPPLGKEWCAEPYANIALFAPKNSGKTNLIYNMLKEFAGPETKIHAFVSTLRNDSSWEAIQKHFDDDGIVFHGYTSIKDGKTDMLKKFISDREGEKRQSEEDKEPPAIDMLSFDDPPAPPEEKKRKSKCIEPEYIIVLDDLSAELKQPSVAELIKTNRHFKCKTIISDQYLNDLIKGARANLDIWIVFGGIEEDKLKKIYQEAGMNVGFPKFLSMYHDATRQPYGFLYYNTKQRQFRKNFDQQYSI